MKLKQILFITIFIFAFTIPSNAQTQRKVVFLDSYHKGYEWSDRILHAVRMVLQPEDIEVVDYHMNTKLNPNESYVQRAGEKAMRFILDENPDLIIASDDNASKFVINPYFKNSEIPVIFCGVNWDSSIYGYPYNNTTGMVEVNLVNKMVQQLFKYSDSGYRIGYLASDTWTEKREAKAYKSILGIDLSNERFVSNSEEWKTAFLELQEMVDVLIIGTFSFPPEEEEDIENFVLNHIKIPTGALNEFLMPYALIGYLKVPEEFGLWAGKTAIEVLNGKAISSIELTRNTRADLILNLKIANKLNIVFKTDLLKHASIRW